MFERIVTKTISHATSKDILDTFDEALLRYFEENNISYKLEVFEPLTRSYSYRRNLFAAWLDWVRINRMFKKLDKTII